MSDMLSHWAIFEDCRKIAALDEKFDAGLTEVIEKQLEYARLGTVSRGGNRWMQPIMARASVRLGAASLSARRRRRCQARMPSVCPPSVQERVKYNQLPSTISTCSTARSLLPPTNACVGMATTVMLMQMARTSRPS